VTNPTEVRRSKLEAVFAGIRVGLPSEPKITRAIPYPACQAVKDGTTVDPLNLLRLRPVSVPERIFETVVSKVLGLIKSRIYGKIRVKHPTYSV
jgi:hypothetical protein